MSIRRKQTLIMMLTSSVALLLACAAFIGFETIGFRKDMVQNLSTLAKIIGNNTSAALDFNDPQSAEETLLALEVQPNIIGACVFSRNGDVFSKYDRPGDNILFMPPSKSQAAGYSFGKASLTIFEPITSKGEVIGMIYLESDMRALHTKLTQYVVITAAVFILTLLVAFLLSARLQRLISEPILDLVRTARAVAQDKNYSVRVVKRGADEIGVLVDNFNGMLSQIQTRDDALRSARDDLELRVEERTKELAESQSLYHSLVDQMPMGVFRKNGEGRYVFVNPWFCHLKGMSAAEFIGKTPREVAESQLAKQDATERTTKYAFEGKAHHEKIMRTGESVEQDEEYRDADGKTQFMHVVKSPVFGLNGKIVGSQGIIVDISHRKHAAQELEKVHRQLIEASRQAGMAEVASNVLHNVGNVLNSVNISTSLVAEKIRGSKISNLEKVGILLREHSGDLPAFLTSDAKGRQLPEYLTSLAQHLTEEQRALLDELALLAQNIEHIKHIVAMQQNYAKVSGISETVAVVGLVEDAVRMNEGAFTRHNVQVIREYADVPPITTQKHKVLQILVNLMRNAKHALRDGGGNEKKMRLRIENNGGTAIKILVIDNGVGIAPENLTRIFSHGFTTRKDGHGFGLHSGALAAKELGGSLNVQSDGHGHGATFTLELPLNPDGLAGDDFNL